MALDEKKLRAAGLPAALISLLVSITKTAERAAAAAATVKVSVELGAGIGQAAQVRQVKARDQQGQQAVDMRKVVGREKQQVRHQAASPQTVVR